MLELPQRMNGGRAPAWDEVQKMCRAAQKAGSKRHLDGTRLFEVV